MGLAPEPSPLGITPKLASALADPYGGRILSALANRDLSPSEFVQRFEGELDYVSRCFRRLRRLGYAHVVERRPGRTRGASVQHVYRSVDRADLDMSPLRSLPPRLRCTESHRILSSYFEAVREALRAGTFDAQAGGHLSWDRVALDPEGFAELSARLAEIEAGIGGREALERGREAVRDGSEVVASFGLASFRAPLEAEAIMQAPDRLPHPANESAGDESSPIRPELAKALSNRWRSRILMELNVRPLSPSRFFEELGGDRSYVARCFRELAAWGYAEVTEERNGGRNGGGVERIYSSTARAYFDQAGWEALPAFLRVEILIGFLNSYLEMIQRALLAGTFDRDDNRHLSWRKAVLDEDRWESISQRLDAAMEWLPELEAESVERTGGDPGRLIPTVVGLAAFRSPHRVR